MSLGETTARTAAALSLLLLLCALPAAAFTESYAISAPSPVQLFRCASGDFSFSITNTGDIPSGYSVGFADAGVAYIRKAAVKSPFILNAGTSATIPVHLAMPCDGSDSTLQIVVDTVSGKRQVLPVTIAGVTAENAQLTLAGSDATVYPCQRATFTASLANPHNFTETYSLSVENALESTTLSASTATLAPGRSQDIAVSIRPTDCSLIGSFTPRLTARSGHSGHIGTLDLPLTILSEGTPQIVAPATAVSRGFPAELTFTIRNAGSIPATFSLAAQGMDGASVIPSSVTLDGSASAEALLLVENADASLTGGFPITITARSEETGDEAVHPLTLTVKRTLPIRGLSIIAGSLLGLLLALAIILAVAERVDKGAFKRKLSETLAAVTLKDVRARRKREQALRRMREERERQRKLKQIAALRREVARELRREYRMVSKRAPRKSSIAWRRWLKKAAWLLCAAALLAGAGFGIYHWYINRAAVGRWFIDAWGWMAGKSAAAWSWTRDSYASGAFDAYIPWLLYAACALAGIISLFILAYIVGRLRRSAMRKREEAQASESGAPASQVISADEKEIPRPISRGWRGVFVILGLFAIVALIAAAYHFRDILLQHMDATWAALGTLAVFSLIGFLWGRKARRIRMRSLSAGTEPHSVRLGWGTGIGEIAFVLNEHAEKLSLRVRKGLYESVYAEPGERLFQYFHIGHTHGAANFGKSHLRFSVPYAWMSRMGVSAADIRLVRFDNGAWVRLPTRIIEKNGKRVYFQADAESLPGQYAIIGKSSKPARRSRLPHVMVALVALLLAVSLVYISYPADNGPAVPGIPAQVWDADTTHKLDLSQFFNDPDGDGLAFSVEGNSHIVIDFQDAVAIMMPPNSWSGSDFVTFTATDGKGGEVRSNLVHLRVRDALIPLEWVPVAQRAISASLLVALLVLFSLFRKPILRAFSRK